MSEVTPTVISVPTVYRPDERPDVEVLVDGQWRSGELRMVHDDGRLNVQYRLNGDVYLDNFPAERVRRDTVDRAGGRQ